MRHQGHPGHRRDPAPAVTTERVPGDPGAVSRANLAAPRANPVDPPRPARSRAAPLSVCARRVRLTRRPASARATRVVRAVRATGLTARSIGMLVLALLVAACTGVGAGTSGGSTAGGGPASGSGGPVELTVFAAASLKGAFNRLASAFEAAHPGVKVVFSYDASSTLRTQIELGAPADVFASADMANVQALSAANLTTTPAQAFAGNGLVVILAPGNPAQLTSPLDLARPGIKLVTAGPNVPISRYTVQVIANLARQPGYPADYEAAVSANIVSREDNVKGIVIKVELGEADAGIVYLTDATASGKVGTLQVPAAAQVLATYGVVALKASSHPAEAAAFVAMLRSPAGQRILAGFGFVPAGP